jgi:hypothetical protein
MSPRAEGGGAPEAVVVLGMHRSGTSVATRLAALRGLALCHPDDLLAGFPGNPRGHWESRSLLAFDERLLRELDGTWFCPPSLEPPQLVERLEPHRRRAGALLRAAHPRRPFVWKDPRACLLLPFWQRVLGSRAAYVLVTRHPREVAESLERRNGLALPYAVALWERYTRLALLGCAGRPTMVSTYEEVLSDPVAWSERLAGFLGDLGLDLPRVDDAPIAAFVAGGLRTGRRPPQDLGLPELFGPERTALAEAAGRAGAYPSFAPPPLPPEAPATEELLRDARRTIGGERSFRPRIGAIPARFAAPRSPRPAATGPPASLVLATPVPLADDELLAMARALPRGSEILTSEAERLAGVLAGTPVSLRGPREPGSATEPSPRLAAAAIDVAAGRTVYLLSADPPADAAWPARMQEALASSKAGTVGAVLLTEEEPAARRTWGAFTSRDLIPSPVPAGRGEGLARAPLLLGGLCAFDRRVLVAAGGIDPGFDTLTAAMAELSLRLWRMGFAPFVLLDLEVRARRDGAQSEPALYERLRIGSLHLEPGRLRELDRRAGKSPAAGAARARLAQPELRSRRALVDAVCAFSSARYFEMFPSAPASAGARARRVLATVARRARRLRLRAFTDSPSGHLRAVARATLRRRARGAGPAAR